MEPSREIQLFPNGHVRSLRNDMVPYHFETTFPVRHLQDIVSHYRKNLLNENEVLVSLQMRFYKVWNHSTVRHDIRPRIYSEALLW